MDLVCAMQVASAIADMVKRLQGLSRPLTEKEKLVLRLNEQYPSDVGVLSAFFLNLVTLKEGQVSEWATAHTFSCRISEVSYSSC